MPALLELLADDARFTMPPLPAWFAGRADVERFLTERLFATAWELVPLTVNDQLGFGCYSSSGGYYRLAAVNVLTLRDGAVSEITGFVDPAVLRFFQLPEQGAAVLSAPRATRARGPMSSGLPPSRYR